MSLEARSDPHSVYATVLRGFGLTRSELPPPHDGEGEVTVEGVGDDLVAAGVADPHEHLIATLVDSAHGFEAPRRYWSEAPAEHLRPVLAAFGYQFTLKSEPDGDGHTVGAALHTGESVRRMTYTYPEDGDGSDNYPALVHAIERRLLPEAGPTFVRLADDGDCWRFALVERWRLAELRELFGDRLTVFGDPLLAPQQPAGLYGEGGEESVETVDLPTEELDDAFGAVRRAAVAEPVQPTRPGAVSAAVAEDPEVAAVLRGVGVDLGEGRAADVGTPAVEDDSGRPSTGAGTLWSAPEAEFDLAADAGVDRPAKRYTGEDDPMDDRDRFVPSDPPGLGADAAEDQVAAAETAADRPGATDDGPTPFGDTLDSTDPGDGAARDGSTEPADGRAAESRDDSPAAPASDAPTSHHTAGASAGPQSEPADTRSTAATAPATDARPDASTSPDRPEETAADGPLSQQVASTLGDASAATDAPAAGRDGATEPADRPEDATATDTRTASTEPGDATDDWSHTTETDATERVDADILSTITEWVETRRR